MKLGVRLGFLQLVRTNRAVHGLNIDLIVCSFSQRIRCSRRLCSLFISLFLFLFIVRRSQQFSRINYCPQKSSLDLKIYHCHVPTFLKVKRKAITKLQTNYWPLQSCFMCNVPYPQGHALSLLSFPNYRYAFVREKQVHYHPIFLSFLFFFLPFFSFLVIIYSVENDFVFSFLIQSVSRSYSLLRGYIHFHPIRLFLSFMQI